MSESVRFYFDFISPYAYVAWTQIHRLAEAQGRGVEPIPVLFAGLLNHHGQKGPAEIPAKRLYAFKDAFRKAHRYALPPLVPPPSHPFNPLLALRVASIDLPAADRRSLIDRLYAAVWAGGGGIEGPDRVAQIADDAGLDGAALVAQANEPGIKERLRRATEAAIAADVFGVPTMIVDGELFWGVDGLEPMTEHLAGRDPVPTDLAARWDTLPATAARR